MKIAIIGAGVIGVTSAWYLAKSGHEVIVFDRQPAPAMETSFANAGQVSFGYSSPWAAPGIPSKAVRWLLMEHAPLIIRPKPDLAMLRWLLAMLANCSSDKYAVNKGRMLRLAEYSRLCLDELRSETGIAYDAQTKGTLQLFRTEAQVEAAQKDMKALASDNIPHRLVDVHGCIEIEPTLSHARDRITGGLHTPLDETGDCFKFTQALAERAADLGVRFHFGRAVERIAVEGGKVSAIVTDRDGRIGFDKVVVAAGSYSARLVRDLGIDLPVYPVKGYSLTVPLIDDARAPQSTVLDETYKIAITRLGERIRIGGMAEISGYTKDLPTKRRRTLETSVTDLFPGGDLSKATFWTGLRPMTPDGTPIVGDTEIEGLYLNTGHGTLGWTMSTGSGRLLRDILERRPSDLRAADYVLERYAG